MDATPDQDSKDTLPTEEKPVSESQVALAEDEATAAAHRQAEAHDYEPAISVTVRSHRRRNVLLAILATIVIAAGAAYLFLYRQNKPAPAAPAKTVQAAKPTPVATDPQLERFIHPTTGETWYKTPQKIKKQAFFVPARDANHFDPEEFTDYYLVGTRGDNKIILTDEAEQGDYFLWFEQAPDGSVHWIVQPNTNAAPANQIDKDCTSSCELSLAKNVTVDSTTHYDSLTIPKSLTFGTNQSVMPAYDGWDQLTDYTQQPLDGVTNTVVKQYGQSRLVRVTTIDVANHYTNVEYELELPDGIETSMFYMPISRDMSKYTWQNGVTVQPTKDDGKLGDPQSYNYYSHYMSSLARGCGGQGNGVSILANASDADFTVAGTSPDGKQVYQFKDTNAPLLQLLYKEYKEGGYFPTDDPNIAGKPDSFATFLKNHAVVTYKDGTDWLVYLRNSYAPEMGCGKPVVYLYPTQTERVSVRVGADVTVSDPLYNPYTGWQVLAQPNGRLTVNGRQYGSLFWEGIGAGRYPAITGGTVVPRADAAAVMRRQLVQQGLTSKEASDFLAYWRDKIPNSPYVRLTWFNTAQMNQLAPLRITPRPDTTIRVFLDMEGYDQPISLPAQQLNATPRHGFTVVEWGGLIQGKLR